MGSTAARLDFCKLSPRNLLPKPRLAHEHGRPPLSNFSGYSLRHGLSSEFCRSHNLKSLPPRCGPVWEHEIVFASSFVALRLSSATIPSSLPAFALLVRLWSVPYRPCNSLVSLAICFTLYSSIATSERRQDPARPCSHASTMILSRRVHSCHHKGSLCSRNWECCKAARVNRGSFSVSVLQDLSHLDHSCRLAVRSGKKPATGLRQTDALLPGWERPQLELQCSLATFPCFIQP